MMVARYLLFIGSCFLCAYSAFLYVFYYIIHYSKK